MRNRERQTSRERERVRERELRKSSILKIQKRTVNDEVNKKLKYYDEKGKKCT